MSGTTTVVSGDDLSRTYEEMRTQKGSKMNSFECFVEAVDTAFESEGVFALFHVRPDGACRETCKAYIAWLGSTAQSLAESSEVMESDKQAINRMLYQVWLENDMMEEDSGLTWKEFVNTETHNTLWLYSIMASTSTKGEKDVNDTLRKYHKLDRSMNFARSMGGYSFAFGCVYGQPEDACRAEAELTAKGGHLGRKYDRIMSDGGFPDDDKLSLRILRRKLPKQPEDSEVLYSVKQMAFIEALAFVGWSRRYSTTQSPSAICRSMLGLEKEDSFMFSFDRDAYDGPKLYGMTPQEALAVFDRLPPTKVLEYPPVVDLDIDFGAPWDEEIDDPYRLVDPPPIDDRVLSHHAY